MKKIIVTRHYALIALLIERGLAARCPVCLGRGLSPEQLLMEVQTIDRCVDCDGLGTSDEVIEHVADPAVLDGAHAIGVLPMHLAARCARVTEIPMALTPADREAMQRGDLSLDRTREIAGKAETYTVRSRAQWSEEQLAKDYLGADLERIGEGRYVYSPQTMPAGFEPGTRFSVTERALGDLGVRLEDARAEVMVQWEKDLTPIAE